MNRHTLVRLLCTATETPNINYRSCEQTHTCSAAVYENSIVSELDAIRPLNILIDNLFSWGHLFNYIIDLTALALLSETSSEPDDDITVSTELMNR